MILDLVGIYPELDSIIESCRDEIMRASTTELGPLCEDLSTYYRVAGISALLVQLDVDRCYHMLDRSGQTRIFLLEHTPPANVEISRYCRATRANGFFDSVAACRPDLARRIALLSPHRWNERYEYEDDYCYISFLHGVASGAKEDDQRAVFQQFSAVLGHAKSVRRDVCVALLERDARAFEAAFASLLEDRSHEIESMEKLLNRNELEFATSRHIFVEGLALLRIAEVLAMDVQGEFPYCPCELRTPRVAAPAT